MAFDLSIPAPNGKALSLHIEAGNSAIFVGANGGGKTRLSTFLEEALKQKAHRVSAHRALKLNPAVPKISEKDALAGLRWGWAGEGSSLDYRIGHRWGQKAAVSLLNDFDFLVQALFANQANVALVTHRNARGGNAGTPSLTKFEQLEAIWDRLLPHRKLHVTGDDIQVSIPGPGQPYSAAEMSDGERAIFYTIGQALSADKDSLLIFDEPELHIHRAVMSKLWDELEAARSDCAFVFITHDLEFAATRVAQKYVIRDYLPTPAWLIEGVPEDTGFPEDIATLILGSRKPILFVEGTEDSLDIATYRCCYPEWTVIPRGSCEDVIHSVSTMRRNAQLTRVTCSGIVDADHYTEAEIENLKRLGIAVLPVSEIENIYLLPDVSRAIAQCEGYEGKDLEAQLKRLKDEIFESVKSPGAREALVIRYCRRRIDRTLKQIDLGAAKASSELIALFNRQIESIDVRAMEAELIRKLDDAIRQEDVKGLLAIYDNKGLMALASSHLKKTNRGEFEAWLTRILRNNKAPAVASAIRTTLPTLRAL